MTATSTSATPRRRWLPRLTHGTPPAPSANVSGGFAAAPPKPAPRPTGSTPSTPTPPSRSASSATSPGATISVAPLLVPIRTKPRTGATASPSTTAAPATPKGTTGIARTPVPLASFAPGTVPVFKTAPKPVVAMTDAVFQPWTFSVTKDGIQGKEVAPTGVPAVATAPTPSASAAKVAPPKA